MNRLLEVYSRGLYDSLNKENMADVVEHFQNISNDTSVHGLADLFKNKTVQKDEKLKAAMELVGGDEDIEALIKTLEKCNDEMSPEDIQTLIYSTGKDNGYSENLRDWFKLIYEVVFGDENGPRMGFFISFFGVNETKDLIINKLK